MTLDDPREAAVQLETYLRLSPDSDMARFVKELLEECRELLRSGLKEEPHSQEFLF